MLKELNQLIEQKASFKKLGERVNGVDEVISNTPGNLYFKWGQYYYLKNQRLDALQNYIKAFSSGPLEKLKQEICLALAAFYYTLDDDDKKGNFEKALQYIDAVTPIEYEKNRDQLILMMKAIKIGLNEKRLPS